MKDFENIEIEVPNINVKAVAKAEHNNLLNLQKQRTKANKGRKPYWQAKIDAHFFGE